MKRAAVLLFVCMSAAIFAQQKTQTPLLTCAANPTKPCAKVPPKRIEGPDPEYSEEARRNGINATLHFSVVIGTNGRITDITPEDHAGYGLDEKAVEALRRWRFKPAKMEDGTEVPVRVKVEITFSL